MGDKKRTDMLLESEKMLGKRRFKDGPLNRKKKKSLVTESAIPESIVKSYSGLQENSGEIGDPSDGLLTRGGMIKNPSDGLLTRGGIIQNPSSGHEDHMYDHRESTRKLNLNRIWNENEHRFLYNPFSKEIDFRKFRPTDYNLNKHINLPRPLTVEQELDCELRRRDYMKVFDQFTESKVSHHKKDGTQSLNLTKSEERGLKSLKKRIQNGELCGAQTDKSS